jgi:hypothetical protein
MVTNERQRQYANQTRHAKNNPEDPIPIDITSRSPQTPSGDNRQSKDNTPQHPDLDPKLNNYHYSLEQSFNAAEEAIAAIDTQQRMPQASKLSLHYHVNIMSQGVRIRPKLDLTPTSCRGYPDLLGHVNGVLNDDQMELSTIKVLGSNGLADVFDDGTWAAAVKNVEENDWMDGDVKIVAEVTHI